MEGTIAIWAMIWWILAIINIVFCVLIKKRYKKIGLEGAGKRIILSWVIILCGIIVGSMIAGAINSRNPVPTVFCIAYLSEIIAIIYTASAANSAKDD